MRPPRLPPIDTSEYISCPIDTPLLDFDQKSPLPCIIVTPSSPTEYHIAFHHKSSPLDHVSFAAAQQQSQTQHPRPRRAFLNTLNPFVGTPPPIVSAFNIPPRRTLFEQRARTMLILAVPVFIIALHMLISLFIRDGDLRGAFFNTSGRGRGGFSSAVAHMRAQISAHAHANPNPHPALRPD